MQFLLSAQQLEIQGAVQRYFDRALPGARLHEIADSDAGFDSRLWQGFAVIGGAGLLAAERYGGLGLELIDAAIVAEALGRAAAPLPFLGHQLAILALQLAGSEEQQARWLPHLADGSKIGAVAFRDSGGWQPGQWSLAGGAMLSGEKRHVLAADRADLIIVGTAGGMLCAVTAGAPGLTLMHENGVDRTRRMASLRFDGTPAEPLPRSTPEISARLRDAGLSLLAADAFGGGARCLEMAVEHAKTRMQFGVAIAQFQALKHQLANMAAEIEPARGLYWYAAHAFDHVPQQAPRAAALAKAHLADRYVQAARDAVEAHGGIGYTWEYDLQLWFKRAMFDSAWLGGSVEHRQRAADLAGW